MADSKESPKPKESRAIFTSEGYDIIEIREEDTKPGKMSEQTRKRLEEKYGRKAPPPKEPPDKGAGDQPG